MSFFNAIAAFKGAFLGALLGNGVSHRGAESVRPHGSHGPVHGKPVITHRHPSRSTFGHTHHAKPHHHTPHLQPLAVSDHQLPYQPLYPLFSLSR